MICVVMPRCVLILIFLEQGRSWQTFIGLTYYFTKFSIAHLISEVKLSYNVLEL